LTWLVRRSQIRELPHFPEIPFRNAVSAQIAARPQLAQTAHFQHCENKRRFPQNLSLYLSKCS
jgi:hypothetical protein